MFVRAKLLAASCFSWRVPPPERLCPSPRTRRILLVWFCLRSAQRRGYHPGLHRRSDQVSKSLLFRLSPASQSILPAHKQTHVHCGDVLGPNFPVDTPRLSSDLLCQEGLSGPSTGVESP